MKYYALVKERNPVIFNDMNGPAWNLARLNKPGKETQRPRDSTHMWKMQLL